MDVSWLQGERCTAVEHSAPGEFLFHFGAAGLRLSCAWRLRQDGRIILAHADHGQRFGLPAPVDVPAAALAHLAGRVIVGGRIEDHVGDIILEFSEGCRLEVFNDSSGYEGWSMTAPDGTQLIAASGGEVSSYRDEA